MPHSAILITRRLRLPAVARSLRIVAALLLAGLIALTIHQILRSRLLILADTERQMTRLDRVLAEQTGRTVETVDLLIRDVIDSLPAGTAAGPPTGALLERRMAGLRQVVRVEVTDAAGLIIASSVPAEIGASLPQAGEALVAFHRANKDAGVQISDPVRLDDKRWTALMTRRINAPDGAFAGITAAALDLGFFEDFYRAVELEENGAIMLHRGDGTVLARTPHLDDAVGRSFAQTPPFRDILAHAVAGTVIMDSPLDGTRRVLAIRALPGFPLAVNVSVGEADVLAGWRHETWVFVGSALAVGLAIFWLLLLLARRSRQIEALLAESQTANAAAEQANDRLVEQMAERERAEAALRQTQRIEAIGQLTGGLAHDFNNLLTVVLGNISLLEQNDTLDRQQQERLGTMRAAAERGATLTAQLLAFARRQPLVARDIDLNAMLRGMMDLLQSALGSRMRIDLNLASDLWPARIDPTQIELVVLNLAINARDATPRGGVLTISTRNERLRPATVTDGGPADAPAEGDYVALEVADTGTGMSEAVLARAFEPFFTTKATGRGSGLGLSQVFGVARQSGGGVRMRSAPGKGTQVTVWVPRGQTVPAMAAGPARAMRDAAAPDASVLVVDDDTLVRDTTAQVVAGLGYRVVRAASGDEALALLRDAAGSAERRVDVLLTDVAMPDMTGPDLAREVLRLRPDLPIVFITGFADPETIAGDTPLHRLVRKPFRQAELGAQLAAALAERREARLGEVSEVAGERE